MASAVAGGSAISSVALIFLVRRIPWRTLGTLTLLLPVLPMIGSLFEKDYYLFMALQGLASLGGGSTYSLALTALADSRHPDRAFGLALVRCLSAARVSRPVVARNKPALLTVPALLALGGCFFSFFNVGSVGAYLARMAVLADFTPQQIGTGLAIGVSLGIPGALLASWCGDRFGRILPLAIGAAGTVVSLWLLGEGMRFVTFVIAVALYNFVWNFSLAFQYAAVNAVDRGGRAVAAAPALHGAGVALGPGAVAGTEVEV